MWASHASPEGRRTVSGHSPLCSPVFSSVPSAWQRYPASHASCQREPALEGFVWHCSWIWPLHWGTTNCAGSSLRGDLSLVFHLSQRARGPLRDLGYWWVDVSTAILLWNDWHTSCCGPALGPVLPKIHYFEYVLPCLLRLMLSMLLANELGSRKKKFSLSCRSHLQGILRGQICQSGGADGYVTNEKRFQRSGVEIR